LAFSRKTIEFGSTIRISAKGDAFFQASTEIILTSGFALFSRTTIESNRTI
jgi:hypothetical protein